MSFIFFRITLNVTHTGGQSHCEGTVLVTKLIKREQKNKNKRGWIQRVNRMPRNRLPRVMKYYSPTGRRNHGRPLKRLLDT
jgi:hypothetical protein